MFDFLKKAFQQPSQKPGYKFVEQYVLVQPKKLLIDYSLFEARKTIPVAYEQETNMGWNKCLVLPNEKPIRLFLKRLRDAEPDAVDAAKQRTISVIKIDDQRTIYVMPAFKGKKPYEIFGKMADGDKYIWPHYVTPEINQAIVDQIKIHTR